MRRTQWIFGAASLMVTHLFGQVDTPRSRTEIWFKAAIRGRVVDSVTGVGVPGALVTQGREFIRTSFSGEFMFSETEGEHALGVAHPGYREAYLLVTKKQAAGSVLVTLTPYGAVAGQLTDSLGEPIPYVTVQLLSEHILSGTRSLQVFKTGSTDDRGIYRIWGVPAGKYLLRALGRSAQVPMMGSLPDGAQNPPAGLFERFGPSYYPGVSGRGGAASLSVAAGGEVRADMKLGAQPAYAVAGRILGHRPGAPLQLELYSEGDLVGVLSRVNRESGEFSLDDVAAGTYLLRATSGSQSQQFGQQTLAVSRNMAGIEVTVAPEATVEVSSGGNPACRNTTLSLLTLEVPWNSTRRNTFVRRDDKLAVSVPPGHYHLEAQGSCYLAAATSAATDVVDHGLAVAPGGTTRVDVRLEMAAGQLRFDLGEAVKKGQTVDIAIFSDDPLGRAAYEFRLPVPNEPGAMVDAPQKLAPGSYLVWAWQGPEGLAYWDSREREAWRAQAVKVVVAEEDARTVKLRLLNRVRP